jgi:hypothetical protein
VGRTDWSNGLALVTTRFSGEGSTPLGQIDLATNTFKIRRDAPGSAGPSVVAGDTYIHRSADGQRRYLLESTFQMALLSPIAPRPTLSDKRGKRARLMPTRL